MAPKFDPNDIIEVCVRVTGGEVGAASSLAPKIGPLGLSPKKVGEDIAKETAKDWKGLRVTVRLTVQNRQAKVSVVPSAAALVIRALKEEPRDRKKPMKQPSASPLPAHIQAPPQAMCLQLGSAAEPRAAGRTSAAQAAPPSAWAAAHPARQQPPAASVPTDEARCSGSKCRRPGSDPSELAPAQLGLEKQLRTTGAPQPQWHNQLADCGNGYPGAQHASTQACCLQQWPPQQLTAVAGKGERSVSGGTQWGQLMTHSGSSPFRSADHAAEHPHSTPYPGSACHAAATSPSHTHVPTRAQSQSSVCVSGQGQQPATPSLLPLEHGAPEGVAAWVCGLPPLVSTSTWRCFYSPVSGTATVASERCATWRQTLRPVQVKNVKHTGNIKFEDILEIARIMRPRSCARSLAGTCKEMLGTAVSVGCTVDHKTPGEIMEMIDNGEQEVPTD
ncbi:MAG: hypothetical protein WDW38_009090 [Sanguina aurantia]